MAATARGALEALRAEPPDVLVADIGMPGEDGYWLIEEVRRTDELRRLPAIELTGFASRQDQARTRAAGYQRHVAKPVDVPALVEAVAALAHRGRKPPRRAGTGGDPRVAHLH